MVREAFGKLHAGFHIGGDRREDVTQRSWIELVGYGAQRPQQRHAGFDQRGELAGAEDQLCATGGFKPEATSTRTHPDTPAVDLGSALHGLIARLKRP